MGLALTKEQFEQKVAVKPDTACHHWTGATNADGYGMHNRTRAHRIAYELHKGLIPATIDGERAVVRHTCDNPICVNPDHLILGTQRQNIQDAVDRLRMPRRLEHHWGVHSDEVLDGVCLALIRGEPNHRIAERFGVSTSHVSAIRHGKKERERFVALGGVPATGRSDRQLTNEQVLYAYNSRGTLAEAAARLGVSPATIRDIRVGKTYRDVTGLEA